MDLSTTDVIKLAIDQTIEGIQIISPEWRYLYVNDATVRQGRSKRETLLNRTMMEAYPGIENAPFFEVLRYVMERREPRQMENEFVYENGQKCWFDLRIEPFTHGILIRSVDITEKKKIEEQLRHAQKMESLGRLAGGISHDFNNKLGIMMAYCELGLERIQNRDEVLKSYFDRILQTIDQSATLARQLLAFSRRQVLDIKVVNLNTLVEGIRESLARMLGETIDLEFAPGSQLGATRIDPAQFEEVILNLCVNARDAMPEGGQLRIETKNVDLDEKYVGTRADVIAGPYVQITVSDTGSGMTPEVLKKAFDPFFTTKAKGQGTGLGLAMVHGFVTQCNGHIWAYSEVGRGTVFKIYLPRVSQTAETRRPRVELTDVRGRGELILLVEDDPMLRDAYYSILKDSGYQLLVAATAAEGERLFEEHRKGIHLVLTDLILPDRNGRVMIERLRKIDSKLKAAYMSGYTENSIVHQGVLDTESVLLQKPISVQRLLNAIRQILDGTLTKGVL